MCSKTFVKRKKTTYGLMGTEKDKRKKRLSGKRGEGQRTEREEKGGEVMMIHVFWMTHVRIEDITCAIQSTPVVISSPFSFHLCSYDPLLSPYNNSSLAVPTSPTLSSSLQMNFSDQGCGIKKDFCAWRIVLHFYGNLSFKIDVCLLRQHLRFDRTQI